MGEKNHIQSDLIEGEATPKESALHFSLQKNHRQFLFDDCPEKQTSSDYFLASFKSLQSSNLTSISTFNSETHLNKTVWCGGIMSILNSCLLSIINIEELKSYLIKHYFSGELVGKPLSIMCAKLFIAFSCMSSGTIDSSIMKAFIEKNYPQIVYCKFIDLFRYIIDGMIDELADHPAVVFEQLFCGKITREIICLNCNDKVHSVEQFNDLSLEVSQSIERSLELFNREGRIINYCNICNDTMDCSQRLTILEQPLYLVLSLKRFIDVPYTHKINTFCKFKKSIDINDQRFEINSLVVHDGDTEDQRYVQFSKNYGKWFMHFDKTSKKVSSKFVLSQNALVLIYRKIES